MNFVKTHTKSYFIFATFDDISIHESNSLCFSTTFRGFPSSSLSVKICITSISSLRLTYFEPLRLRFFELFELSDSIKVVCCEILFEAVFVSMEAVCEAEMRFSSLLIDWCTKALTTVILWFFALSAMNSFLLMVLKKLLIPGDDDDTVVEPIKNQSSILKMKKHL